MAITAEILAGGYYAFAMIFALGGMAFAFATKDRLYAFFALHALAIGGLALTFPPIAPAVDAVTAGHVTARIIAEGLVIATVGLLLNHLVLPVSARWLRPVILAIFPFGLLSASSSWWFAQNMGLLPDYGGVLLVVLCVIAVALISGVVRKSGEATMLAVALAPLVAVGALAATLEMLNSGSLVNYDKLMLMGFAFELICVTFMLANRLRNAMQDRDNALADALEARRDSETDPLTLLPNRRAFDRILANAPGRNYAALAIIDCDNFKSINDNFGHALGDRVLQSIARCLASSGCLVSRIGGEEFGIFLPDDGWRDTLDTIRMQITRRVSGEVPELPVPVTVSMGAIGLHPSQPAPMAFSLADNALYQAKANGRNRVEIGRPTKLKTPIAA